MAYPKSYNPCDDCPYSFSKNNQESNMCKICEFKQLLDKPTADVVEVVRCKDCEFWQEKWHDVSINQVWGECHQAISCLGKYTETEEDDFCSCGEKR